MQVRQEDMLDPFLFFQCQACSESPRIYHKFIIDEKSHTSANMRAAWSIQKHVRPMGSKYANLQAWLLLWEEIFMLLRLLFFFIKIKRRRIDSSR